MRKYIKKIKPEWIDIEFPSHLIDKAFSEASGNYDKCMVKYNKYHIEFKMKLKTKKDKFQTFNVEKTMFNKDKTALFTNLKYQHKFVFRDLKFSQNLRKYNMLDSSITCNTKLNEYYVNVNFKNNFSLKKNKLCLDNKKVCAIDPGNRCFLTVYSDNKIEQIGLNITDRIYKTCNEIDIITSKIYKKNKDQTSKRKFRHNKNSRRNMKKALHRKIKYLKNIKDELHNKSIKFLTENYAKIILPPFEIQKMSGKFNSKIARTLYNLSFYTFKKKLENKCIEKDINLVIRPEYYTSKTCTNCGNIKHDLGSAEIYKCRLCNIKIGRDIAAARNIMLRNHDFTKTGI
jgi:transposase